MYFEVESLQKYSTTNMNKSVEDLLISSRDVMNNISSTGLESQNVTTNMGNGKSDNIQEIPAAGGAEKSSPVSSPNLSPHPSPKVRSKRDHSKGSSDSATKESNNLNKVEEHQLRDITNKSPDSSQIVKHLHEGKKETRNSERSKKKTSWYNVLYPTYKSRSEDFKRIFKDVPDDERLVVDYSCALQREILVHGRLYVSQNYICFYANIFSWETLVSLRWKDVTSITKEKTALVIPNAILICTASEKFFLTSFGARDKTYVMLFRVWQNALIEVCMPHAMYNIKHSFVSKKCDFLVIEQEIEQGRIIAATCELGSALPDIIYFERDGSMCAAEMWQLVHSCYGDELGLTSDDEDYVPPLPPADEEKLSTRLSVESFSEVESGNMEHSAVGVDAILESKAELQHRSRSDPILDATDLSDTTESEAEKHALKPSLRGSIICTAPHEGRQICKALLPIHIDQLFTLLFTNSKFFLDFQTARKTTDLVQSAWTQNEQTGQKTRNLSFTIALSQAIGPRTSHITETQIMLPYSKPGHLYSIDVESVNAGIPYADSFSVFLHYCMSSISENETSITIYAQINYKKNVWAFVKGVIEKNCWAGIEEYFTSLIKALTIECEENTNNGGIKRKARRRRRVTGLGVALQSHSADHVSSGLQNSLNLPHINDTAVSGVRSDANMVVSSILLIAVLCLMVINGLLYYKLWSLEEAAAYTIMDLHVLKSTPKTEDDWINLLQQQESLHNVEMRKWQRVLHTAAQLLRQTEESLTELQMSIHPTATEKMFSVLKPSIKSLNSRTEQRSHSEI